MTRKDAWRCWEFARCYWAKTLGEVVSGMRLPENMWELGDGFWRRVDATISKVL